MAWTGKTEMIKNNKLPIKGASVKDANGDMVRTNGPDPTGGKIKPKK